MWCWLAASVTHAPVHGAVGFLQRVVQSGHVGLSRHVLQARLRHRFPETTRQKSFEENRLQIRLLLVVYFILWSPMFVLWSYVICMFKRTRRLQTQHTHSLTLATALWSVMSLLAEAANERQLNGRCLCLQQNLQLMIILTFLIILLFLLMSSFLQDVSSVSEHHKVFYIQKIPTKQTHSYRKQKQTMFNLLKYPTGKKWWGKVAAYSRTQYNMFIKTVKHLFKSCIYTSFIKWQDEVDWGQRFPGLGLVFC